jgi:hypothetical protein
MRDGAAATGVPRRSAGGSTVNPFELLPDLIYEAVWPNRYEP